MDVFPFFPVLMVGGFVCVIGVVLYVQHLAEKKRTEDMARAAEDLGLSFVPAGDDAFRSSLDGFQITERGHTKKLHNLLRGDVGGADVAVFDYQFTTGGGKSRHTHKQTVVCLRLGVDLPDFTLRPEGFWDKVGSLFGFQDINFEAHPTFSGRYLLRSPDEEAVRRLFGDEVIAFYELRTGVCTESARGVLLYYRAGSRCDAAAVKGLLDDALDVAARFMASAGG